MQSGLTSQSAVLTSVWWGFVTKKGAPGNETVQVRSIVVDSGTVYIYIYTNVNRNDKKPYTSPRLLVTLFAFTCLEVVVPVVARKISTRS